MNLFRTLLIGLLVLPTLQAGATAQGSKSADPKVAELVAIDNTWGKYFTSCDIAGMDKLVADDLTIVQLGGTIWNKSQYMDVVKRCSMEVGQRLSVARAQILGDTAVVVGTFKYQMKGQKEPGYHIYHRTYIKQNGTWRLMVDSHVPTLTP